MVRNLLQITINYFAMKILKLSVFCLLITFISCGSSKKLDDIKEYDKTICELVDKAQRGRIKETQIMTLAQYYHQANQSDFAKVMELKKSGQPDIWLEVFNRTNNINDRQNKVDKLPKDIKAAINYKHLDLQEELTNSKTKAEAFLSAKANKLLEEPDENNIKEATVLISKLQRLNPKNQNIDDLRLRLVVSSADRILLRIATPTDLDMPDDFARLALDFDDNTLYNVPFDIVPIDSISYDLMIRVMINEKKITPERIESVTFEEKNGEKTAKVTDKTMSKAATIIGDIEFIDVKNKSILMKTPFDISSTFHHKYAVFEGDSEACSEQTLSLLDSETVDFPSDNALLKDTARRLNCILKQHYQKK